MKISTHRLLTHKKIIIIFLFAIFLPLLIAVYLSLSTFPKRREAVKKLLESNLWISGDAALRSIEGSLGEYEQRILRSENFIHLLQSKKTDQVNISSSIISEDTPGKTFLLNNEFKIVFPETAGSENTFGMQWEKEMQNSQFGQLFNRAEYFEFSRKNYLHAAELYRECALYTSSKQHRAIATEGLARCLLSSEKYYEASKVYNELSKNYGHFTNRAGHPYGITAIFQLYEIARKIKEGGDYPGILLNLYKQLREGVWLINQPVYDFYISEVESILDNIFVEAKFPELQKSYADIRREPSPYNQNLVFIDFLKRNTIPVIKDKLSLTRAESEFVPERFLTTFDKDLALVSYVILPDFQAGQTFYGGLCWDLNLLKNQIIKNIIEEVSKDTGLDFRIIDESNQNITAGKEELMAGESLALAFRSFPLPWKLLVSNPEIATIQISARREIFFYGVLLIIIIALMLLGAVLIVRDVARESETNRLKTEFVNNISHELKTPLTLIRLYGETLQRKEDLTNKEKKECYEIITKESERLSHLINNVLDFSKIEMGRKEFNFKKGYIQDVIRDTLESYSYHLEKKGFTVHSDITRDLPEMNFDGEAISSVLINLLSNAMKFSPGDKEVTMKLFRDNGNAVLQVADKGIGILPGEISKIFQRFYQSENKISSEMKGSGLGLTLVKHIAEAHNGRVQVESEPGKGSVFSVILPISDTENYNTK
jgi:signal transduction histidine kinase